MPAALRIRAAHLHRLAVPLRFRFEHAAAARDVADPIVLQLNGAAPYAEHVGFGETLARPYVTGETPESVLDSIQRHYLPRLRDFQPESFFEALEFIEDLPAECDGRVTTAARAAVELALLDLAGRAFRRSVVEAAGWLGLAGFGPPGSLPTARFSGIVVGRSQKRLQWLIRLQRCLGLRDFKLKVAVDGWQERLRWTYALLGRAIESQRATLRVDANAGWSLAEAHEAIEPLEAGGVSAIEQPLPEANDPDLAWLAEQTRCDLIADESLVTLDDCRQLLADGAVKVFNIRIAKVGGLLPALRMARQVLAAGRDVQLGCLVGETSVLSAAGLAFLEICPRVRFVEGAFGTLLLRCDITRRSLRFGLGGRIGRLRGPGLGVEVDPARLRALALERERVMTF